MSVFNLSEQMERENLFRLDYLVYSSHKTGTQSLHRTLNLNGFTCKHCHDLTHLNLRRDDLRGFADLYYQRNGRKLKIISVYREPVERYIASFFQEHGTRPLRLQLVRDKRETLIYQRPLRELQAMFCRALEKKNIICYPESLHDIYRQLGLSAGTLHFDETAAFSLTKLDSLDLCLMRFDRLFADPAACLSRLTGKELRLHSTNIGSQKWYADIYQAFKSSLRLPPDLIRRRYREQQDLLSLFYPGTHADLLTRTLRHFGAESSDDDCRSPAGD